jgi:tetratricopeptide (TPR) repeat protein
VHREKAAGVCATDAVELDDGAALIDRALQLNPNLAMAWLFSGWVKVWLGESEVAIEHLARAMRLSPSDPNIFNMQAATALAHFFAGRYAEASSWAEAAAREKPNHLIATSLVAASGALAGRLSGAEKAMARLRQLDPTLVFPISGIWAPSADRRISHGGQMVCARPGCRSELSVP